MDRPHPLNPSTFTVRAAQSADADVLARLALQLGYPSTGADLRERLGLLAGRADHEVFVAEGGGGIVGWVHVLCEIHLESGEFAEIAGLVVDEGERGKGAGRMLLVAAEAWARGRGFASIRLRTNVVRAEAHRFYERAGYAVRKEQKVFMKGL
jgi:GNAT superfamily N-acetyltransferase